MTTVTQSAPFTKGLPKRASSPNEQIRKVRIPRCLSIACHLGISSTDARRRLMCLGSDIPAYWKCLSSMSGISAMLSYSTSVKLFTYIGSPSDVSQSSRDARLPSVSLVKSNSDTLHSTCERNKTRHKLTLFTLHQKCKFSL